MPFLKVNGEVAKSYGRFIEVTPDGDIILTLEVIGSYFPARPNSGSTTAVTILGKDGVNNKAFIDFQDGTGEHEYAFKTSGVLRRIAFGTVANAITKATISVTGIFSYPCYFFQDLAPGVKDTVIDNYGSPRPIKIRFEKPQDITSITFNRVLLYNQLPSSLAKLSKLEILSISSAVNITSFPQDFNDSKIKTITFSNVGPVFDTGFPFWILNSTLLQNLNLSDSINLSGSAVAKRFNLINKRKDSLLTLGLANSGISYQMPQELGEMYKLTSLNVSNNISPAMRFPADLSGLIALEVVDINRTKIPLTEFERIIQGLPALKSINFKNSDVIVDYDFAAVNNKLETIEIGGGAWNNGAVPTFVNKLLALKYLNLTQVSGNLQTALNSYGNFANCTNLETINISRITTMTTSIPAWFSNLTKLKTIFAPAVFTTQVRVNEFVNNLYAFVVANASMTNTTDNKFRGMTIDLYGSTTIDTTNSVKPSGVYQQPAGYIQGVNNGTPASAMEKIWVLYAQYGHVWLVKPI